MDLILILFGCNYIQLKPFHWSDPRSSPRKKGSKAFAMYDGSSSFLILRRQDTHRIKARHGGKELCSHESPVKSLAEQSKFGSGRESQELLLHSLCHSPKAHAPTREQKRRIQ